MRNAGLERKKISNAISIKCLSSDLSSYQDAVERDCPCRIGSNMCKSSPERKCILRKGSYHWLRKHLREGFSCDLSTSIISSRYRNECIYEGETQAVHNNTYYTAQEWNTERSLKLLKWFRKEMTINWTATVEEKIYLILDMFRK